jgi:hypothetical protein
LDSYSGNRVRVPYVVVNVVYAVLAAIEAKAANEVSVVIVANEANRLSFNPI